MRPMKHLRTKSPLTSPCNNSIRISFIRTECAQGFRQISKLRALKDGMTITWHDIMLTEISDFLDFLLFTLISITLIINNHKKTKQMERKKDRANLKLHLLGGKCVVAKGAKLSR